MYNNTVYCTIIKLTKEMFYINHVATAVKINTNK